MSKFIIKIIDEKSATLYEALSLTKIQNFSVEDDLPPALKNVGRSVIQVFIPGNFCITNVDALPKLGPLDTIRLIGLRNDSFRTNCKLWGYKVHIIDKVFYLYQAGVGSKFDAWSRKLEGLNVTFRVQSLEISEVAKQLVQDMTAPIIISYLTDNYVLKLFGFWKRGLVLYREIALSDKEEASSKAGSHIDESVKYLSRKGGGDPQVFILNTSLEDIIKGYQNRILQELIPDIKGANLEEQLLNLFVKSKRSVMKLSLSPKKLPVNLNPWFMSNQDNFKKVGYLFGMIAIILLSIDAVHLFEVTGDIKTVDSKIQVLDELLDKQNVGAMRQAVESFKQVSSTKKSPDVFLKRLDLVLANQATTLEDLVWEVTPEGVVCEIGFFVGNYDMDKQEVHDRFESLMEEINGEFGKEHVTLIKAPFNMATNSVFVGGNLAEEASLYARLKIRDNKP